MASWYSNLLTKTSSQISNLRTTLLSSETDGDTEDDTHVARVLRNYYTEKGRPFPPWLPPDPKAPAQQPVQPLYANAGMGAMAGRPMAQQQPGGNAGGLSSLWDNNAGQQQAQQQVPQSLRAGGGRGMGGGLQRQTAAAGMGDRPNTGSSYQSQQGPGREGAGSAQDRLKQRLWGGRTTSPGAGSQAPFQPPPPQGGPAGGGGGGAQTYMSANSPWSGGADGYQAGGGVPGGNARSELPSGGRRGLPSNPRGYR